MTDTCHYFRNNTLAVQCGDITELDVDVVVNAANASLCGGGGVDGAIHAAAGPALLAHCRQLGAANPGDAVLTPGFQLAARFIVHAVGPVWRGGDAHEAQQLESAYRQSMCRATEVDARTIAFPCISAGAYRYPFDHAMSVAIDTVEHQLASTSLHRVTFCCFCQRDYQRYVAELRRRYPTQETTAAAALAELFVPPPNQWGLRGDPFLWKAMREGFATTELPRDDQQLTRLVAAAFLREVGVPLETIEPVFVEAFSRGGISSGRVSPEFWRTRAIPLLCERLRDFPSG